MSSEIKANSIQDKTGTRVLASDSGSAWSWGTPPVGTVLQVVQNESSETNALTTGYVNYYEVSIQLKSSSSDVYGFFNFQYQAQPGAGFGVKVYRNNSATVTTSHTAVWTKNLVDTSSRPYTWYNGNASSMYNVGSINTKDTITGFSAGDTLYYGLFARKAFSAIVTLPFNDDEDGFISSTLIEVQK